MASRPIRPDDLPATEAVNPNAALIIDTGQAVQKATPRQIMDAARPAATEADALAGADNVKLMTALRVKQAMDARPAVERVATLAAMKAGSPDKAYSFSGANYHYAAGDFTGRADDVNVVKLDAVPLTAGALVRQAAALITARRTAGLAVDRNAQDKINEIISVNDFGARGDGVTDDTAAINAAILYAYARGGGTVTFGESSARYRVLGTIYVVSRVVLDGCGQTLSSGGGSLFRCANVVAGAFVPIEVFDPYSVVEHASIRDFTIRGASVAFNLVSFTLGCSVQNIEFFGCTQGFRLLECFYSRWQNLIARPNNGSASLPFYELRGAANDMLFDRITCAVSWGWLVDVGNTALVWLSCSFEGGNLGFKIKGDLLGGKWIGCYFEAVGTLFDFSEAGSVWGRWDSNYINYVDRVFVDGGQTAANAALRGFWCASNYIANINGVLPGNPNPYRGRMEISGRRNFIEWRAPVDADSASQALPANWIIGKHTNFAINFYWVSTGTEVRAVARRHGGITPRCHGGDVGTPFAATIPFSTVAIPVGASVTGTVTTGITLQPNASVVHFVIAVNDNSGLRKVSGTIYGDFVDQRQGMDRPVSISQDANGNLILNIGSINNASGSSSMTGSVYLGT